MTFLITGGAGFIGSHLAAQGLRRVVLCFENQSAQTRQHITIPESLEVTFIEETMPRGTAGCIRDAAEPGSDELLMILRRGGRRPPDTGRDARKNQIAQDLCPQAANSEPAGGH